MGRSASQTRDHQDPGGNLSPDLFATALGLSIAAGVSPYATVAVVGLAHRIGWIDTLPAALSALDNPWVMTLAIAITLVEFVATLVPGVASAWEAAHAAIRPPAAAAATAMLLWGGEPALVLATSLLGGVLAFGTSLTKLGARLAIDTSPEPVSNAAASVGEIAFVALIAIFVWQHPVWSLIIALLVVVTMALLVRAVWGMIWRTVTRVRRPGVGAIRS